MPVTSNEVTDGIFGSTLYWRVASSLDRGPSCPYETLGSSRYHTAPSLFQFCDHTQQTTPVTQGLLGLFGQKGTRKSIFLQIKPDTAFISDIFWQ
jgi:hypothetical protein